MDNYTYSYGEEQISSLFYGFLIYSTSILTFYNWRKICSKIYDLAILAPGKGRLRIKTIKKKKTFYIETNYGDIHIPLVKMHDFDMVFGFFDNDVEYEEGMYKLENFKDMSSYTRLPSYDTYWVCHYRKPSDFKGKKEVTGFVFSHIDDAILIFKVNNNETIEYETYLQMYLDQIENFEPDTFYSSTEEENNDKIEENNDKIEENNDKTKFVVL